MVCCTVWWKTALLILVNVGFVYLYFYYEILIYFFKIYLMHRQFRWKLVFLLIIKYRKKLPCGKYLVSKRIIKYYDSHHDHFWLQSVTYCFIIQIFHQKNLIINDLIFGGYWNCRNLIGRENIFAFHSIISGSTGSRTGSSLN